MAFARSETDPRWDRFTEAAAPAPSTATSFAPTPVAPAPTLDQAAVVAPSTATSLSPTTTTNPLITDEEKRKQAGMLPAAPSSMFDQPTAQNFYVTPEQLAHLQELFNQTQSYIPPKFYSRMQQFGVAPPTNISPNSSWTLQHAPGLRYLEDFIIAGVPLPPEAVNALMKYSQVAPRYDANGVVTNSADLWNSAVAKIQDIESGHGPFGIEELSTGDPFTDSGIQMFLSFLASAYLGGASAGESGGSAGGTTAGSTGAFDMGGSAGVFDSAGNPLYSSPGMLPSLSQLGTNFGVSLLNSGGNVGAAARNTAIGAGISTGANFAAPVVNSAFESFNPNVQYADTTTPYTTPTTDYGFDSTKRYGMLPTPSNADIFANLDLQDAEGLGALLGEPRSGMLSAADREGLLAAGFDLGGPLDTTIPIPLNSDGTLRYDVPGVLTVKDSQTLGGIATQKALEAAGLQPSFIPIPMLGVNVAGGEQPATEAPRSDQQSVQREVVTADQLVRLSKLGSALAKLHDGRAVPQDAPQRREGESDQEYAQSLVDYVNPSATTSDGRRSVQYQSLSPEAMASLGLVPGSADYYNYILDQLDAIVAQVTQGLDVDSADLASQLRAKSREDLDTLERVLYVRGVINELMRSGRAFNPFTGLTEDVIAPNSEMFNPAIAAYQRGLARNADELARLSPLVARRYIGGMLDRATPDLYGMRARQDARAFLESLASQDLLDDTDLKRRRGAMSIDDWQALLDAMPPDTLQRLLAGFGG